MSPMRTWRELVTAVKRTPEEEFIVQCIAAISTHPVYAHMTPEHIFFLMCHAGSGA